MPPIWLLVKQADKLNCKLNVPITVGCSIWVAVIRIAYRAPALVLMVV
jgi:hypothetical protein